jgi:hypothetical protein
MELVCAGSMAESSTYHKRGKWNYQGSSLMLKVLFEVNRIELLKWQLLNK